MLRTLTLTISILLFLSIYFVIEYYLDRKSLSEQIDSIDKLDKVYFRDSCLTNSFAFLRESQIINETWKFTEDSPPALDTTLEICLKLENNYTDIRKDFPVYF